MNEIRGDSVKEVRSGGTPKPTLGTEEAEGTSGGWWTGEPSVLPGFYFAASFMVGVL